MKRFSAIIAAAFIAASCSFITPTVSYAGSTTSKMETLESCLERAHNSNLDLQEAASGMKIQKLSRGKARAKKYLTATGESRVSRRTSYYDYDTDISRTSNEHKIEVRQPLYYFGDNTNEYLKQNALYHKERLNFLQTLMETERDIRKIYIDILRTNRKINFQKEYKEFIEKYISDNGGQDSAKFDKLHVFIEQINMDLVDNKTKLTNSINQLNMELNTDELDKNTKFITFGTIESYDIGAYFSSHNTNNDKDIGDIAVIYASIHSPAWIMKDYEIEASEYSLKKAKSALFPKIDAQASWKRAELDRNSYWDLGLHGDFKFITPEDWKEISIQKEQLNKSKINKENFQNKYSFQIKSSIQDLVNIHSQIQLNTKKMIIASEYLTKTIHDTIEDPVRISDIFETYYSNCSSRIDSIYEYLSKECEISALVGNSVFLHSPSIYQFAEKSVIDKKIDYTKDSYYDSKAMHKMHQIVEEEDIEAAEETLNKLKNKSNEPVAGGWNKLHFFAFWNKPNKIKELAKNKEALNHRALDGATPLYMAITKGHKEAVEELINSGADISITGEYWEWTPLEKAANRGFYDICKILIDNGADINKKSKIGKNAFHNAIQQGHSEIVKLFVKNGADLKVKTADGLTPTQLAQTEGYINIYQYLKGLEEKENEKVHDNNRKRNINRSQKTENNSGRAEK
ncbi:MAG: ankyrin repeat domain-containing protein [bacterium]|nr:ankyrin repeat domain-containing protein [bacterium]